MFTQSPSEQILNEFEAEVKKILPDIKIINSGYGNGYHVGSLGENHCLQGSRYFQIVENRDFFHLTSYRNLFSIINSGFLRLYNLKNSDDPNELDSLCEHGYDPLVVNHLKEKTFIFSSCNVDSLPNTRLWSTYGKVAIVYRFTNSSLNWHNFHFAKVQYQRNDAFRLLTNLIQSFQNRYRANFDFDDFTILNAFHKNPTYEWENEVRLMYNSPSISPRFQRYVDFKTSSHHTGFTEYIELPLYIEEATRGFSKFLDQTLIKRTLPERFYETVPCIKIQRIIFGNNEQLVEQKRFN